ncbi:hypothetical protein C3941_16065 [Kaistia algarum]|uniref:hypothetical protein n=1 Tax=Kaistia algarum TaxID=2083279 RepID=UPI000CE8A71A|nr:hypothetical protein [Kaistia algarum]MCX5514669.1 hypothetical protein [Kaistia algarum]PPE78901.1 hypothetical protein C3941_16065 [Kaistia algarum]
MKKILALGAMLAIAVPFTVVPAEAVSSSSARQTCITAAAKQHGDLQGNVQVRKVSKQGSGYQVNLQIQGAEINCIVTSSGKIRYMN